MSELTIAYKNHGPHSGLPTIVNGKEFNGDRLADQADGDATPPARTFAKTGRRQKCAKWGFDPERHPIEPSEKRSPHGQLPS